MDRKTAELLTRSNAGTPMGELMRRYWVPALLSNEIPDADGPQVRVQLLGEKLLAFRDSEGHAALISEFCTHRGVSLFLGRNEENGIRCSYHGLKWDRHGACIDAPIAPNACRQMSITAYPCIERGGIVWAYMGPADKQPEPPELEWAVLPDEHVFVSKRIQECNYLQAMEGGIDTAHITFVHRYEVDIDPMHQGAEAIKYVKADGNVIFTIKDSPAGLTLYGRRNGDEDTYYWRITQFLFPWYTMIPPFGDHALGGHMWIPIDDENCWAWSINWHPERPLTEHELSEMLAGRGIHVEYEEGTFRPKANKGNDWLIDRASQREHRTYSGVSGFSIQDASLQESMGPIQNREIERLLPTDKGIVMVRRMLQQAAEGLQEGKEPPALAPEDQHVHAAAVLLPRDVDPAEWAQTHIFNTSDRKVHSV